MNIRRTNRGYCRMCYNEAWRPLYQLNWQQRQDYGDKIGSECKRQSLEFASRNKDNLFALEAATASGRKIEIICRRHLQELLTNIQTTLGTQE